MRVIIKGVMFQLQNLVDGKGEEIDVFIQKMRNAKTTIRFFKKAFIKNWYTTQRPNY